MSSAVICVGGTGEYSLHYRDWHGEPTGLGTELIATLRSNNLEDILILVAAAPLGRSVHDPEDAFLEVRPQAEWIYAIRECPATNAKTLEIHKTSYGCTRRRFVWKVWSGEVSTMDTGTAVRLMELAEMAGTAVFEALDAYEKAGSLSGAPAGGPVVSERSGPACTESEEASA